MSFIKLENWRSLITNISFFRSDQKSFKPYYNKRQIYRQDNPPYRYPNHSKPFLGQRQPQGISTIRASQVSSGLLFKPINSPEHFLGGKIYSHRNGWRPLTGNQLTQNIVTGNVIELESLPVQDKLLRSLVLSKADQRALDVTIRKFIDFRIVKKCNDLKTDQTFYSIFFPVIKEDS